MSLRRRALAVLLASLPTVVLLRGASASGEVSAYPPSLPELAVPALPPGLPSAVPTDRPLTVQEAIEVALRQQPQIALAQSSLEAASGRMKQAESGTFPSINVVGQHTRSSTAGVGAVGGQFTASGYTMNVSGRQLIYDFGKTPAEVRQARREQYSAAYSLEQTQQDTINNVKQAYYTLLQDQQLAGVQKQNVADQQAHLDLVRGQFEAGVSPRADVIQAEAAVSAAVVNLVTAQSTEAISRVNLNTAMGIDPRTPVTVEEAEEAAPTVSPAEFVTVALAHRPEMEQLRQGVEAARKGVRAALTSNFPAFYVNGNYGLGGREFPPTATSWAYGVSVSWPMFDVGQTRGLIQQAQANLASAQASLLQGEQSVAAEVVQDYLNVQAAEQQVAASATDVANAQESLRVALGSYRAGVVPYINVTDAQTGLVTAETNQVNARYSLSMARAALARALGLAGY